MKGINLNWFKFMNKKELKMKKKEREKGKQEI